MSVLVSCSVFRLLELTVHFSPLLLICKSSLRGAAPHPLPVIIVTQISFSVPCDKITRSSFACGIFCDKASVNFNDLAGAFRVALIHLSLFLCHKDIL